MYPKLPFLRTALLLGLAAGLTAVHVGCVYVQTRRPVSQTETVYREQERQPTVYFRAEAEPREPTVYYHPNPPTRANSGSSAASPQASSPGNATPGSTRPQAMGTQGSGSVERNADQAFDDMDRAIEQTEAQREADRAAQEQAERDRATANPSSSAPGERLLTKQNLIDMAVAGIAESNILLLIERATIDFDVTADVILELQRVGLSDRVIEALIDRANTQPQR